VLNSITLPEVPLAVDGSEMTDLDDKYSCVVNRTEFRKQIKMKWHGCLSDLVRQDEKKSYANLFKFYKIALQKGSCQSTKDVLFASEVMDAQNNTSALLQPE
jgi:hypothetical protein